ncbi:MAG: hypothetical protein ACLP4V_32300 [Methylocella sp.]
MLHRYGILRGAILTSRAGFSVTGAHRGDEIMTFTGATGASPPSILDRERIIAKPGFNCWLVPPATLAIHLCIGMAYGTFRVRL